MIKGIEVENYKAFENAEFKIKPITILLGANSIGKSSLMQLILLLKQTIHTKVEYKSALKLNGEFINLGEPENIFRNFDYQKTVKISFIIENSENVIDANRYFEDIKNNIYSISRDVERLSFMRLSDEVNITTNKTVKKKDTLFDEISDYNYDILKTAKSLKIKQDEILRKPESNSLNNHSERIRYDYKYFVDRIDKINISSLKGSLDFLDRIKDVSTKRLKYKYSINYDKKDNLLIISEIKIFVDRDKLLLGFSNTKSKNGKMIPRIYSDFINHKLLEKYRIEISKSIEFKSLYIIPLNKPYNVGNYYFGRNITVDEKSFINIITDIFITLTRPVYANFNESLINYVSPLRAFPKRYYFLDEAKVGNSFNTINGDNLAEIIKGNPNIKKLVNDWLANFGFEVDVDRLRDIIHHLKVKQGGLKLDITDVGFGISQVLPVIVQGFLSRLNSLTLIEQPEIHLHPKMQADLADLFIDIVKSVDYNKSLLIETHSEYMLKRLRRRISEGKISNEHIGIYFIKKDKNKSIIKEIEIDKYGAFDWPEEFYSNDLEDTIAFIKNQPVQEK